MTLYADVAMSVAFIALIVIAFLCIGYERMRFIAYEPEPKIKDRVRIIIICGNCGAPYHVDNLAPETKIQCRCGKTYEPWKEIEP